MKKRSIRSIKNIRGKRVFVRSDFNVDIDSRGRIQDDMRIVRALPTYQWLLTRGAKIIAATHVGRPAGKKVRALQTDPIARHLSHLLHVPVKKVDESVGEKVTRAVETMRPGTILLLENTRFHKEEQSRDLRFAKELAKNADLFVNDAFGSLHDEDASVAGIARYLPTYAGLLVESELAHIDAFLQKPKRPLVFVLGGAKLSTKVGLIKKLIGFADHVLVCGALATSFFAAAGVLVGKSVVDPDSYKKARLALRAADRKPGHMILPHDVMVAKNVNDKVPRVVGTEAISKTDAVYDIGPETVELYNAIIAKAGTIIFNGAPGVFEQKQFSHATKKIYSAIAHARAKTLAGGGETILALDEYHLASQIDFISTGGGALLSYIEGAPMPGLKGIPNA